MMSHVVWARSVSVKPLSAKTVLLVLASHANQENSAFPSIPLLSRECSMTEQGVINAIKILSQESNPYISVSRLAGKHNFYHLLMKEKERKNDANEEAQILPEEVDTPQLRLPPNYVYPPTTFTPPPNDVEGYPPTTFTPPPNDVEGKEQGKNKVKEQGKKKKGPTPCLADLDLPDWLPRDTWAMWVENRIEIKKPMTLQAAHLTINGLSAARNNGWDPIELIHDAVMKRWQGCVYPQHRKPKPIETTFTLNQQPGVYNGNRKYTIADDDARECLLMQNLAAQEAERHQSAAAC